MCHFVKECNFRLYRTLLVSVCSLGSRHFIIKYADDIGGRLWWGGAARG